MGALWDFVTPAMLWQRSNTHTAVDFPHIDDINWGTQYNGRIKQPMTYWDEAKKKRVPVKTLDDLSRMTEAEVLRTPALGRISLQRIKDVLAEYGLSLKDYSP